MKNLRNVLFISLLAAIYSGCEPDNPSESKLQGLWVSEDVSSDTIIFLTGENDNLFELRRGFHFTDGRWIRKCPCGLFEYKLFGDSIMIQWMASSRFATDKFHFEHSGSRLELGDFIDRTGEILVFRQKLDLPHILH